MRTDLTYGPHDPNTTATTIKWSASRGALPVEVPIHPGLLEQRRRVKLAAGTVRRIVDRRTSP